MATIPDLIQAYAAQPYSPPTYLASNILANSVVIPLKDGDILPAPPNIAVIGTAERAETILYKAKVGNELREVIRGIEEGGVGQAWTEGVPIKRTISAKDVNDLAENARRLHQGLLNTTGAISNALTSHTNARDNPHGITAAQVGAAPTSHRHDANVDSVVPEGLGVAAAGTSTIYARRDHVHSDRINDRFILNEGRAFAVFRAPNSREMPSGILTEIARFNVRQLSWAGYIYWFGRNSNGTSNMVVYAFQTRATQRPIREVVTSLGTEPPTFTLAIENQASNTNYQAVIYATSVQFQRGHWYFVGAEFSNW